MVPIKHIGEKKFIFLRKCSYIKVIIQKFLISSDQNFILDKVNWWYHFENTAIFNTNLKWMWFFFLGSSSVPHFIPNIIYMRERESSNCFFFSNQNQETTWDGHSMFLLNWKKILIEIVKELNICKFQKEIHWARESNFFLEVSMVQREAVRWGPRTVDFSARHRKWQLAQLAC